MRSTPSQWILPKNFFLGLPMRVAPPITWWYSYMHSLFPSGMKFLCMSGCSHSMILILWLLHIPRFNLTCMKILILLKLQLHGFLTLPNSRKLCRNPIYIKSIEILNLNPNLLGLPCCFVSQEKFSFNKDNIIASNIATEIKFFFKPRSCTTSFK